MLGGAFGLELPRDHGAGGTLPFAAPYMQFFLGARCALRALNEVLRPGCVWLPDYFCPSILQAFEGSRTSIRYYRVDRTLRLQSVDWMEEVATGDFVLVIHYFGFPFLDFPAERVRARGGILIEDASQALFLKQQFADSASVLYSPRKFIGVPDGGILASHEPLPCVAVALEEAPGHWWRKALAMTLARRDFDLTGRPNDWFSRFREVEANFPAGLYRASDVSYAIVCGGVDYEAIRTQRRANYSELLERLGEFAIFRELPAEVAPLGFPVVVDREVRDLVLSALHRKQIFAPVHWRVDHELASECLTLICDQRCGLNDMKRQAMEFTRAMERVRAN